MSKGKGVGSMAWMLTKGSIKAGISGAGSFAKDVVKRVAINAGFVTETPDYVFSVLNVSCKTSNFNHDLPAKIKGETDFKCPSCFKTYVIQDLGAKKAGFRVDSVKDHLVVVSSVAPSV